jgi:hypothetical protein
MRVTTSGDSDRHEGRRRYRPPVGVPLERARPWGAPVSLLLHALVIALLLSPFVRDAPVLDASQGAGGPGPAGGGGGGRLGGSTNPTLERLRFVRLAAPPPAPPPMPQRTNPVKPVVKPPVLAPPKIVEQPKVAPVPTSAAVAPATSTDVALAPTAAAGAGTDGSTGAGPGTGGGIGTGSGTGRGSANGPGTGGGEGTIYPATPDFAVIPPLPVPKHLHGRTVELRFTIDETGKVVRFDFDPTGDAGYDRQLRERLSEYHFRPAHKLDGTPVPSVFVTQFVL